MSAGERIALTSGRPGRFLGLEAASSESRTLVESTEMASSESRTLVQSTARLAVRSTDGPMQTDGVAEQTGSLVDVDADGSARVDFPT